jgi:hypothetical protein
MPRTPPLGVPCAATRHIAARHASMGGRQSRSEKTFTMRRCRYDVRCYAMRRSVGRSVGRSRVAKKEGLRSGRYVLEGQ